MAKSNILLSAATIRALKNRVLGPTYDLSLAWVSSRAAQALNRTYRGVDKPASVLSFPLDRGEGEILLNHQVARSEIKKFGWSRHNYYLLLFIHGLLHLKGEVHHSKMEATEKKILHDFLNRLRPGHRHLLNSAGGVRKKSGSPRPGHLVKPARRSRPSAGSS